jgi:hypothetical protein
MAFPPKMQAFLALTVSRRIVARTIAVREMKPGSTMEMDLYLKKDLARGGGSLPRPGQQAAVF